MGIYSANSQINTPFELTDLGVELVKVTGLCKCPICENYFSISIPKNVVDQFMSDEKKHLLSHIYLHGNPCHGLELQIDKNLSIRHSYAVSSIQVCQNSENFAGVVKLWMNRF